MVQVLKDLYRWIPLGLIFVPLNALAHELGHFISYHIFGADNIVLHYASVSADTETLSAAEKAVATISGPMVSLTILVLAFIISRKRYSPVWMILGAVTMLRGLVNIPYLIGRFKGLSGQPNFDEYNFSTYSGIDPVAPAVISILLVIFAIIYFSFLTFRINKVLGIVNLWLSVLTGLVFWGIIGKILLP